MRRFFWFLILLFFCTSPSLGLAISQDFFDAPPPPMVSKIKSEEPKPPLSLIEEVMQSLVIFGRDLTPVVDSWNLLQAHNFLNIMEYDITLFRGPPVHFRGGFFTFMANTADDSYTSYRWFWQNADILVDGELGVRYSFYGPLFVGGGIGLGVYTGFEHGSLTSLIIDRYFIYSEFGFLKLINPLSIVLIKLEVRVGKVFEKIPLLFANRARLFNFALFVGWVFKF